MARFSKTLFRSLFTVNEKLVSFALNAVDWLFRKETLVKSGKTWFELVYDSDLFAVRYYALPGETDIELVNGDRKAISRNRKRIPLVLVPPLGITTETFDLLPNRSLVRYMVASGYSVYLIDWGEPLKRHAHLGLYDYSNTMMSVALEKIRKHSGSQDVSLMGWCMGGLLCLLYQGFTRDNRIRNTITIASPIDLSVGKGVLSSVAKMTKALDKPARLASRLTQIQLKDVKPTRFSLPNWMTTMVFRLTDPVSRVTTYWDLLTRLWDREFVEAHSTTSDYLNNMLRYPGGVVKDISASMIDTNQMPSGKLVVGDKTADFREITSNLLVFAGKRDNLVPSEVADKILLFVNSEDKEFRTASGGHMGVIIGSSSQGEVWRQVSEWLAERSDLSQA